MSYRETIAELDAISRHRALTPDETHRLVRAIHYERYHAPNRNSHTRWRKDEDETAIALRLQGESYHRIAKALRPRTTDAVASRLRHLGYRGATA